MYPVNYTLLNRFLWFPMVHTCIYGDNKSFFPLKLVVGIQGSETKGL